MKNLLHYDEESYELDNVYNEEDLYEDWHNSHGMSTFNDDTLYQVSVNETSIWYN